MINRMFLIAVCGLLLNPKLTLAEDTEAEAALRAKAAAIREQAQVRADKAARQGRAVQNVAAGLVEQVIAQFRLAPAPPQAAPMAAPAVEFDGLVGGDHVVVSEAGIVAAMPAAGGENQPAANGELNAVEQRTLTQVLEPMFVHELAFAHKACGLDEQELKLVSDAAKAELKSIAKEYVKTQRQPRRVVRINGVQRIQPAQPNPRKLIEKSIASAIEAKLPEQQAVVFAQEITKRDDYRKQAGVENLVGFLDERLMLDAAQREQIAESLLKNWDENWISRLEALLNVQDYIPPVPNQLILPHLRQSQKDVWQTASQNNRGITIRGGLQEWNLIAPVEIFNR